MIMKTSKLKIVAFVILLLAGFTSNAQVFTLDNSQSSMVVYGTSNIHDWEINAENQKGLIEISKEDQIQLSKLQITVKTESLKSGKKGMDKNTFKALKTDKYKDVEFELNKAEIVTKVGENKYQVTIAGDLSVAGIKRQKSITTTITNNSEKIVLSGSVELVMTDFNIEPPTALLGTIKTGDAVTLKFTAVFIK